MRRCPHDGCGWQPISASRAGARDQLIDHLFEVHTHEVESSIPDGMVQVKTEADGEWRNVTVDDAKALHRTLHEADEDAEL